MKGEKNIAQTNKKSIIKKCHDCGHLSETPTEIDKCAKCNKSFLPLNYFSKIHSKDSRDYKHLFSHAEEIHEEDLIRGLMVIW